MLDKQTIDKIKAEAVAYANDMPFFNGSLEQGYVAGATEWAGMTQEHLVTALEKIKNNHPASVAAIIASNALAKYKEVTNG